METHGRYIFDENKIRSRVYIKKKNIIMIDLNQRKIRFLQCNIYIELCYESRPSGPKFPESKLVNREFSVIYRDQLDELLSSGIIRRT